MKDGLKDDKFDTPSKDGKGDKTDGRMAKDAQKDKGKDAKDKGWYTCFIQFTFLSLLWS